MIDGSDAGQTLRASLDRSFGQGAARLRNPRKYAPLDGPGGARAPARAPHALVSRRDPLYLLAEQGEEDRESADEPALEVATELSLRLSVLVEFALINLLMPVSVPYTWARFGWTAVRNMKLLTFWPPLEALGKVGLIAWLEIGLAQSSSLLLVAMLCIYAARADALAAQGISWTEVSVPLMMIVVHRLTVGLKYAAMSARELRLFLAAPAHAADAHSQRVQLLTGVLSPRVEDVAIEVARAWREVLASGAHTRAAETGRADELDSTFHVDEAEARQWAHFLEPLGRGSSLAEPAPAGAPLRAVHVGDVLCALVLRASRVPLRFLSALVVGARAMGLVFAGLPLALRALRGQPVVGADASAICCALCACSLTSVWYRINFLFFVVIIAWYERTALEREMLSQLITVHAHAGLSDADGRARAGWPTVDLSSPANVRVFALLAKLQLAYGRSYTLRMTVYQTLVCAAAAAVALVVGSDVWRRQSESQRDPDGPAAGAAGAAGGSPPAAAGGMAQLQPRDRLELEASLPLNFVVLTAASLGALFFVQLRAGSRANEQVRALRMHMLAAISAAHARLEALNLRAARPPADAAAAARDELERESVQQAIDLLLHEKAVLGALADLMPVRLLGLQARMSLAYTVGWSMLTAAVVLLEVVYGVPISANLKLLQPL